MELIDEEQYVDALKLYNRNEGDIMIYLETSTQIYGFHREIVRPLLFETMEKDDATTEYLNILELDFAMAEFAIAAGTENNYIPEHYADLLDDLYIGYSILQNWDKAIEFSNKHVDFIKEQKGAVSQDYAQAIRIQAEMYYKMGKKKIAVSLMQKAKQIYELNENLVRVNYCNRKLDEWK
jgi:tetratricopeptide (TPR) repeat protein